MLNRLKKKIELKRSSKNLIWRSLVLTKDLVWRFSLYLLILKMRLLILLKLRKIIYFLHIHKAGGSTFVNLARQNCTLYQPNANGTPVKILDGSSKLREEWIVNPNTGFNDKIINWKYIEFWKWDIYRQSKFFKKSNFDFIAPESSPFRKSSLGNNMLPKEFVKYVVVLRDPLDLIVSSYYDRRIADDNSGKNKFGSLENFIMSYDKFKDWNNLLVRAFSSNFSKPNLEEAKKRLLKFNALLFLDSYSQDIKIMKIKFGWNIIDTDKFREGTRINSNARELLKDKPNLLKRLQENNTIDLEFYEYAKRVKYIINGGGI